MSTRLQKNFARFGWTTLGVNVLVILWGALVRATGSGAGCGANWPSCQGEIIPSGSSIETWIEFAHRASSGAALVLVIVLVVWAFRAFAPAHFVRQWSLWSLVFIFIEALVGAGLVLFELVAENSSAARAIIIALHLANTFLLLAALALTAWGASQTKLKLKAPPKSQWRIVLGALSLLLLGMSGAVTALGDTLFPMDELERFGEGIQEHFLVQMRAWHPMLAVGLGALVVWVGWRLSKSLSKPLPLARWLAGLYVLQLGVGVLNISLKAPVWMQMIHLLVADAIWVVFVLLVASAFNSVATTSQPPQIARGVTSSPR